jgi:bifunctional non-homologous end joining protein LigD
MKKTVDPLITYKVKRDFSVTPEPGGGIAKHQSPLAYAVQKHSARQMHYDLRLELDGVLKSWAIPKGPTLDPSKKRLAVKVEDHPLEYAEFEGVIPPGQYGAGSVSVWDHGTWEPLGDPREGLSAGHLKFVLRGQKLQGAWALVRMHSQAGEKKETWLLIKERDANARSEAEFNVVEARTDSVISDSGYLSLPSGAQPGSIPSLLAPQLATLVERVPANDDWSYEIKYDGYRIMARFDRDGVALFTRNGHNWTDKFPSLVAVLRELKIDSGWLDGEIVMLGADGMPDFGALQNIVESTRTDETSYYVFDLPFYNGYDLRSAGLAERRVLLAKILSESASPQVRFSEDFAASGGDILHSACQLGLEGIVGKRKDSHYISGRSQSWIKLKCMQRQEFVLAGYTESTGRNRSIRALVLGINDDAGHLRYVGRVGTGFDNRTAAMLQEKLARLAVDKSPLVDPPGEVKAVWVAPELVAEVSFAEWTKEGRVRQAVFHGLRNDKPPALINREMPVRITPPEIKKQSVFRTYEESDLSGSFSLSVSNPDRIVDSSTGLRKVDLVEYYQLASKLILPELKGRPVAFLRAPSGIEGDLFFQKHGDSLNITGLKQLDTGLDPGHPALMEIDSVAALVGAAQMNVIEFHTWNATKRNIEKPDRMVFDIDPGEKATWQMILEAAELIRSLLEELGLESFLKTSGGKGLHVVVPLMPRDDWDTVKEFSKAVSHHLAKVIPSRFTALSGPRNRVGKVFIDYNRNGRGATTVAAYSVRARPGMGVSMPCAWHELAALTGGAHWTITNARPRLESSVDPWESYRKTKQILRAASKKIILPH